MTFFLRARASTRKETEETASDDCGDGTRFRDLVVGQVVDAY
jgi:hypothetical protein